MGNSQSSESTSPSLDERERKEPGLPSAAENRQSHLPSTTSRKTIPKHAPPTATLVSGGGSASISTSSAQAHATTVSVSPKRTQAHTRARSITATPKLGSPSHSSSGSPAAMGNTESKSVRPPSRSNTLPPNAPHHVSANNQASTSASQPVDVPQPAAAAHDVERERNSVDIYNTPTYGLPPPIYSRPPRLPLPIEEEVHSPGSPILSPEDIVEPLDENDVEGALPRRTSITSSALDDSSGDDMDDYNQGHKVPTKLEWNGRGDKIFVTGTFCNWERKMKLHRNKDGKPGFSAIIMLPAGTHHIKFLVDNDMVTSPDMPTTVDWTNILVNYIEILAPTDSKTEQKQVSAPGPVRTVSGTATALDRIRTADWPGPNERKSPRTPETAADLPLASSEAKPVDIPATTSRKADPESIPKTDTQKATTPLKDTPSRSKYTNEIPQFLLDFESLPRNDERHQRASRVIHHLPRPPTLPSTLNKSILNGATPHKDDASVLLMPNHTVLNHLATSSIKQGVLATSGTTRYKRKFLTTIMYRPTTNDG